METQRQITIFKQKSFITHEQIQINEEADNNNGPLSPADMENIENNNAVDYIPNRNEIERLVEPVIISFEQEEQQQPLFDRSNPFNEQIRNYAYDVTHSNANNPFVNNINNENVVITVECSENQIDQIESSNSQIKSAVKLIDEAISLESSLSEKSVNDVNSVEEALRALDFAISGEESLLQPNEEEFEDCTNEDVKFTDIDIVNNFSLYDEEKSKNINNKTTNLYDSEYMDEIRKEAEILVNSVIEESQGKISQGLVPIKPVMNETLDEGNKHTTTMKQHRQESTISDEEFLIRDLPSVGSVENLCFDNIYLEASTPFVKSKGTRWDIAANDSDVFASPTVNITNDMEEIFGISPLLLDTHAGQLGSVTTNVNGTFVKNERIEDDSTAFLDSPQANATFDIETKQSKGISPCLSDTKQLDKTFPLPNKDPVNSTYTSSEEPTNDSMLVKTECPTIKIDKEDSTSVDMTTVTPVNTPIELNYSLDSWDKFISNSMSQELVMPKHIVEMQPCTSAQAAYAESSTNSGWFLHSKTDGKFKIIILSLLFC